MAGHWGLQGRGRKKRPRLIRSEHQRPHVSHRSDAWVGETSTGYLGPAGDMKRAWSKAWTSRYEMHELCSSNGRRGDHGQQRPTVHLKGVERKCSLHTRTGSEERQSPGEVAGANSLDVAIGSQCAHAQKHQAVHPTYQFLFVNYTSTKPANGREWGTAQPRSGLRSEGPRLIRKQHGRLSPLVSLNEALMGSLKIFIDFKYLRNQTWLIQL